MDALVQSYPYPWVTWSHNGRLLQNTSNVASETRLKICNVTANQDGRYSCYAENIFGHDIFTVDVKVQGIDFICSQASFVRVDVACKERETQKFCCIWSITFFYCYSCCYFSFLICFACLFSLIFFCFVFNGFIIFLLYNLQFQRKTAHLLRRFRVELRR